MKEAISLVFTVVAIGLSLRFARSTMRGFTGVCVTIAVASITWNDIKPAAFPLSDFLLLLSLIPVLFHLIRRKAQATLPLLCICGILMVALAVILNALIPTSQLYELARYSGDPGLSGLQPTSETVRIVTSLENGIKLLVGMFVMPLAIMDVAPDRRRLMTLFDLWGISALVNAIVADVDATHITHIGRYLVPPALGVGRQSGLTNHPNHLATVCVMAVPIVLSWWRRSPKWRRTSIISLLIILLAIFETGSRGGLAAGAFIVVVGVLVQREVRQAIQPMVLPVLLIAGAIAVLDPGIVHTVLHHTRIGSASGSGSDQAREEVARQAILDIKHRLSIGVGFDVADQGHSIYLQAIASGGVLTLAGLVVYVTGTLRTVRIRHSDMMRNMTIAAVVSLLGWLVLGSIENDFADRYPYVPLAMLLAFAALRARGPEPAPVGGVPAMREPPPLPRRAELVS